MRTPAGYLIYTYFGMVLFSRLLFRHRELVRAAGEGAGARSRLSGMLLCLLPLGLMQLVPFAEYWLRYAGRLAPGKEGDGVFALVGAECVVSGAVLFLAGVMLARRASLQLACAWRDAPGTLYTGGVYAVIRHPLYAAYLLQGTGCVLMLGGRWSWIAYGLAAALILIRIEQEDRELAAHFPASAGYFRRVKRLVPGVF